jgi:hypothetical protein
LNVLLVYDNYGEMGHKYVDIKKSFHHPMFQYATQITSHQVGSVIKNHGAPIPISNLLFNTSYDDCDKGD